ncbi:Hypothetical protein AKI40_2426 [Enterobacter sp. FY-07]|nr:Hypothetical protein AKI40_2426 [Enterobacter sp. FY-07]
MSALWIELEKGFTNEGIVHELSWIPGVQTGGVLSAKPPANGIDLRQKKLIWRNRFPFPLRFMQFLAIFLQINHLVE